MLGACAALGLLLCGLCCGGQAVADSGPDTGSGTGARSNAGPSVQVHTVMVTRHRLDESINAFGTVQPDPDALASISLPRAGQISRVWVQTGQRVRAGDPLLALDTAPAARMAYQQARAALDYARSELTRIKGLFAEQMATREQLATAQRNLHDAQAALATQKKLGSNQAREILRAPFAGIVTQLGVAAGQRVQAGSPALLLARRDALIVALGVEQEDAARIHAGMPVDLQPVFQSPIERNASAGDPVLVPTISARVEAVHAMVNPHTRLVDVLVRIPAHTPASNSPASNSAAPKSAAQQSGMALVLGATLRGRIVLRRVDALSVPRSAVLRDGRGEYVFVVRDGRAQRIDVTTGLRQQGQVEIRKGLHIGEQVVSLGNYELHDGMAVRVVAAHSDTPHNGTPLDRSGQ